MTPPLVVLKDPRRAEYMRQYRLRNLEKLRAVGRDLSRRQREDVNYKDRYRAYCEKNKERIAAQRRKRAVERYAENPEHYRAKNRAKQARQRAILVAAGGKWPSVRSEVSVVNCNRRRMRIANASGRGVRLSDWMQVLKDASGFCAYCGRKGSHLTQDHVIPLSRGGEHDPDNVIAACKACNSSKHNLEMVLWLARRRTNV